MFAEYCVLPHTGARATTAITVTVMISWPSKQGCIVSAAVRMSEYCDVCGVNAGREEDNTTAPAAVTVKSGEPGVRE